MEELASRLNQIEMRIEAIEKWMASQIHSNDQFMIELNQIKELCSNLESQGPKSPIEPLGSDALGG